MKKIILSILFISFFFIENIKATNFEKIHFSYITEKEGLNNESINCFYRDSIGFLWIATSTNLFRYNGKDVTNMGEKKILSNFYASNINFLTFKNSNFYFINRRLFTIYNTETNKTTSFKTKDYFAIENKTNRLLKCLIDNDNNLWIVTKFSIYKAIKKDNKIIDFQRINIKKSEPNLIISCIYKDKNKNLWVGTKEGVYIYNEKKDSSIYLNDKIPYLQKYQINNIKEDKEGNIWIGQTMRLIEIYKNQNSFKSKKIKAKAFFIKHYNTFSYVKDFSFDSKGNIWVLLPKNIVIVEPTKTSFNLHKIHSENNKRGLSSNNFSSILIDNEGIVFIGTTEGIVNKYNPYNKDIISKSPINHIGPFDINCSCKDYNGNIWLGVNNHSLDYYLTKKNKFIEVKIDSSFSIINIFETKEHEIFFTSISSNLAYGGLFRLNNLDSFYKTLDDKKLSITIFNSLNIKGAKDNMSLGYFATQDIDGTFWYIVINEGTYHLGYKNRKMYILDFFTKKNADKHGLENVIGLNMNILNDSSLYIASSSNKAFNYNRQKNTFSDSYNFTKKLNIKNIKNLNFTYLDKKGRHWFGTEGGGLIRYNKDDSTNITCFNKNNGLNSNSVFCGLMDNNSNMWIGTTYGISIIDTSDIIHNLTNINKEGNRISKYTGQQLNDSTIFFAGQKGLIIINPKTIYDKFNNYNSKIGIKNIFINGINLENSKENKSKYDIKKLTLESFENNIQIEIATLSFSNPNENTISYKLIPIDKKWKKNIKGNKKITLNNLKHGKYTLTCRVINSDGKTSDITKSIDIIIKRPIFLNWYFVITYIILLIVLIYIIELIFRRNIVKKNNRLKKQVDEQTKELINKNSELASTNATKTKMFSVIAHDLIGPIGNVMTSNHFSIENYNQFLEENKLITFMKLNDDSLSSIYELLQNLLFWSRQQQSKIEINPSKFNLYDLSEEVNTLLKFSLAKKKNTLIIDIPKNLVLYADKQMIYTILRNIISNANKFTEKGIITIKTLDSQNNTTISISDTGVGMPKDKANNLFGKNETKSTRGTAGEPGTGLGLIVSKEFILKHKGAISVSSVINKGTTINFTISKDL